MKRKVRGNVSKSMTDLDFDNVDDPIKDHFELIECAFGKELNQRY